MRTFDLSLLSKYRVELMGFATILILVCHAPQYGVILPITIKKIFLLGNLGVEIFFFLSGIGMMFSINNLRGSLYHWYKKRFIRVLVPYLTIAIPWYTIKAFIDDQSFMTFLCNVSTINYWLHHQGAWFIAILLPLYIVTPVFYQLMKVNEVLFLFIGVCTTVMCGIIQTEGLWGNIVYAVHRLPCFFIGMYIAKYVINKTKISCGLLICYVIILIAFLRCLSPQIGWQWPIIFIFIILICKYLECFSQTSKILRFMGVISLESYIANICLGDLTANIFSQLGNFKYCLIIIVGMLISYYVNKLDNKIIIKLL